MKILTATEKPFAAAAVNGIKEICQAAGHEAVLLEKYTDSSFLMRQPMLTPSSCAPTKSPRK